MKLGFVIFTLLWIFSAPSVYAEWVWVPEIGWVNSRYNRRAVAQELFNKGKQEMAQKNYDEAVSLFNKVVSDHPTVPESKEALYLFSDCLTAQGSYYEAYLICEEYLEKYPDSSLLPQILKKEYELGTLLLQGKGHRRKMLGIGMLSSVSLGQDILNKVIKASPYADFADDAYIAMADYHFAEREFPEAQEIYKKIIKEYAQSEWLPYAQYQLALCAMEQFRGFPYEREPLLLAEKRLQEYFIKYPNGSQMEQARQKHKEVRNLLAQKEVETALFYVDQGLWHSAKICLVYAVKEYSDTPTALRAKWILSEVRQSGH
jgi:outer membrane assembly lipoprotein YfiO